MDLSKEKTEQLQSYVKDYRKARAAGMKKDHGGGGPDPQEQKYHAVFDADTFKAARDEVKSRKSNYLSGGMRFLHQGEK